MRTIRRKWFFLAPLAILGILLFIAIGGQVVRLLWNWLMPALFGSTRSPSGRRSAFWLSAGFSSAASGATAVVALVFDVAWKSVGSR